MNGVRSRGSFADVSGGKESPPPVMPGGEEKRLVADIRGMGRRKARGESAATPVSSVRRCWSEGGRRRRREEATKATWSERRRRHTTQDAPRRTTLALLDGEEDTLRLFAVARSVQYRTAECRRMQPSRLVLVWLNGNFRPNQSVPTSAHCGTAGESPADEEGQMTLVQRRHHEVQTKDNTTRLFPESFSTSSTCWASSPLTGRGL